MGIPCVRDRVVQQALAQVLSPIFEAKFSEWSHGLRANRGCETALELVDRALRHNYEWVAEADITKFFDNVDHDLLMEAVNEGISDGSVLKLIRQFLKAGVMLQGGEEEPSELGTPQGGPLSPLLANIYLDALDKALEAAGIGFVRYADDFVIFAKPRERAEEGLEIAREVLTGLKLRLHPEKTRIASIDEGFDFLGYHYFRDGKGQLQKKVSTKAEARFRQAVNQRTPRHAGQKRPKVSRCTLRRLKKNQRVGGMIRELKTYLIGWWGYFRHTRVTWQQYFNTFDRHVRRRLRCAISGRYAKGRWHQILTNALFTELGLPSLQQRGHDPPLKRVSSPIVG